MGYSPWGCRELDTIEQLHFTSTMTHLSWVALHGMVHSFTELDKVVVHVISLVSFLLLWFSLCLTSNG